ncbi:MAG: hypothetical protein ACOZNI_20720 [Myxococcota bacterium]
MSTLSRLAEWARDLTPRDVPDDVLHLARLQHLGAAGAVRAVAPGASGADAVETARLLALYEYDDFLLAGRAGLGAVTLPWSMAKGHTVEELALATVIGNEIGGRVGLALLLGPRANHADTHAPAAGGAAAGAWLAGESADGIAHAVAGALAAGGRMAPGQAAGGTVGVRAAEAAKQAIGRTGDLALLEPSSAFWAPLCQRPLHGAFGGLGHAWLTRTLVVKPHAAMAWATVAVQAVHEILKRHVKAADKRLRADQVERIEIRAGLLPWSMDVAADPLDPQSPTGLAWSLKRAIGVLVARHGLTAQDLTPEALAEKADDIAAVASRVEVVHDWALTLQTVEHFTRVLGPLFAGLSPMELRGVRSRLKETGGWPRWTTGDLLPIARARPDRVLRNLRVAPGDLGDVRLDEFRWHLPVEVKLYTTRGGWWPERRALPLGSVPTKDVEAVALAKHGGEGARAALDAPGGADAAGWVAGMLA